MATQIVMDRSGDTRHYFDVRDKKALRDAEFRFKALTGAGYTAAVRNADGEASVLRSFDPNAERQGFQDVLLGVVDVLERVEEEFVEVFFGHRALSLEFCLGVFA